MIAIIVRGMGAGTANQGENIQILGIGSDEQQARINAFAYVSGNNSDGIFSGGEAIEVSDHFRSLVDASNDDDAWDGILSKHTALVNAYSYAIVENGALDYIENAYTMPREEA